MCACIYICAYESVSWKLANGCTLDVGVDRHNYSVTFTELLDNFLYFFIYSYIQYKYKTFSAPLSMQHYNYADRRRHLMHIKWTIFMILTYLCVHIYIYTYIYIYMLHTYISRSICVIGCSGRIGKSGYTHPGKPVKVAE